MRELLEVAQEARDAFEDCIIESRKYDKAVDIKDRYFDTVDGDYNFEGMVMKLGIDDAKSMLVELNELKNSSN